jgi:23S rRNA (cytosine1962-C5)-methyltransferase
MQEEKFIMFRNRLVKVFRHLSKQAKRLNISCYRVYDHDLPEFPFSIEIYEDKLYIAEYKRQHRMTDEDHDESIKKSLEVIREVFQIPGQNIFLKLRKKKEGRRAQYQKTGEDKNEFVVHEDQLEFIINLSDYLDTGLFLDHRTTRGMIKKEANGKKVLNLFCYTASFSVYAAAGGAEEVTSVDLSKTYLNWAQGNMQLNGFINRTPLGPPVPVRTGDGGTYNYIQADVKEYLKTIPENYFDIVILDPPTFSNSQRMDSFLDIQRDHAELINDCLKGMKNNGILYFSTNYRKFILDKEKIKASSIKDITKATTPFDFEGRIFRYCFRIIN